MFASDRPQVILYAAARARDGSEMAVGCPFPSWYGMVGQRRFELRDVGIDLAFATRKWGSFKVPIFLEKCGSQFRLGLSEPNQLGRVGFRCHCVSSCPDLERPAFLALRELDARRPNVFARKRAARQLAVSVETLARKCTAKASRGVGQGDTIVESGPNATRGGDSRSRPVPKALRERLGLRKGPSLRQLPGE
jgi:hypothetical protein